MEHSREEKRVSGYQTIWFKLRFNCFSVWKFYQRKYPALDLMGEGFSRGDYFRSDNIEALLTRLMLQKALKVLDLMQPISADMC